MLSYDLALDGPDPQSSPADLQMTSRKSHSESHWPTPGLRGLHLWTLASWAIVQPLLDRLGEGLEFLVAHGVQGFSLVFLVLCLGLVPALSLLVLQALLPRRWRPGAHLLGIAILGGLICLPPIARLQLPDALHWLLALVLASGMANAYRVAPALRGFVTMLSPSVLVFPLVFLFWSPARNLWQSDTSTKKDTGVESEVPIVFLLLDELPLSSLLDEQAKIDKKRLPNFHRLASMSRWYRDTTTVAVSTSAAVPAILTGGYPIPGKHALHRSYPNNLFSLLGSSYEMRVLETSSVLCPSDLCSAAASSRPRLSWPALFSDLELLYLHMIFPLGAASRLPPVDGAWRDFRPTTIPDYSETASIRGGDVVRTFESFLDSLPTRAGATLHFAHLNLPHIPWQFLPSGHQYGPVGLTIYPHGVKKGFWSDEEWHAIQGLQRHLLQLGFVDQLIGRMLDHLEKHEMLEEVLLVVTADHGASFVPGQPRRSVAAATSGDVLRVPLFIKPPGSLAGEVDDRKTETIDILPTMADVLGIQIPWSLEGRAVWSRDAPEREQRFLVKMKGEIVGKRPVPDELGLGPGITRVRGLVGEDARDIYRIGPRPDLLDRGLDELEVQQTEDLRVALVQPWFFEEVDLESGFRPAQVEGAVLGENLGRRPLELAVAVNGTIRAVTYSYRHDTEEIRFSAMLPPSTLEDGRNLVEVFLIREQTLIGPRQESTSSQAAIVSIDGASEIQGFRPGPIRVTEGQLHGYLIADKSYFIGWAADLDAGLPAEKILVFVDDRLVVAASGRARRSRYVLPGRVPGAIFRFPIPFHWIEDPGARNIRYVAVRGNLGSEIHFQDLSSREATWELRSQRPGSGVLIDPDGKVLPIVEDQARGFVDRRRRHGGSLHLAGWVIDPDPGKGVDQVIAFRGDTVLALATRRNRPEVAAELGLADPQDLGFLLAFPYESNADAIRVIVVLREKAIATDVPWHPRIAAEFRAGQY